MERNADAGKRGFRVDGLALGVADIEKLAGVVVPQCLGDLVDQFIGFLGACNPLRSDRYRRRAIDTFISPCGNIALREEPVLVGQPLAASPSMGTNLIGVEEASSTTAPVG